MADSSVIHDGHGQLLGMDSSVHAPYLPDTYVTKAVNRTFRGGLNQTRPRFIEPRVLFLDEEGKEDEDLERLFKEGNIQGVHPYVKTSTYRDAGLVVAVGGSLLFGRVVGSAVVFTKIFEGFSKDKLDVWFAQGEENLYIQNGGTPVWWSGSTSDKAEWITGTSKMPSGTLMAYSHGRIAVSNENNLIAVSDHLYGDGFRSRRNMENFQENTAFVGGSFSMPSNLGQITAMTSLPISGNRNGQGELIVFCENGVASIDLSPQREAWQDAKLVMVGAGGMSPYGAIPVNNDIWYRRQDGIGSLRQARVDETSQWVDTPLSREVSNWLGHDTPHLLRHASMTTFDNRIFSTVNGEIRNNDAGYGSHRFFNGIVALDLYRGSTVNPEAGFGWDGLWTGPRPTAITSLYADGVSRMFVLSFDPDEDAVSGGVNRLYEMSTDSGSDPGNRKIEGRYITKAFHSFSQKSDVYTLKKLTGGGKIRAISGGESMIRMDTRADDYPCWTEYLPPTTVGVSICSPSPKGDCMPSISRPYYSTISAPSPDRETCEQGSERTVGTGYSHQFMMETIGNVTIPWMSVSAVAVPDNERAGCEEPYEGEVSEIVIDCCPEQDFEYNFRKVKEGSQ